MRRRSLLLGGSAAALVGGLGPVLAQASMPTDQKAKLAQMVKDIFPHPEWDDSVYAGALAQLEGLVHNAFPDGLNSLGDDYTGLTVAERTAVLQSIEPTPFFQTVRVVALFSIYSSPPAWREVGYEGPSYEEGGYLFRGFDDIDWLPKPQTDLLP